MKKVANYIQKENVILEIQSYVNVHKVAIILGAFQYEVLKNKVTSSLTKDYQCFLFEGKCSEFNIRKLSNLNEKDFDYIIACGGGVILDVGKAVAYFSGLDLMVIPTSASMDGACSALSVLYKESGEFDRYLYLEKNPDIALVDTTIIFDAPLRLLVAGMGDALATYFETRAYQEVYGSVSKEALNISYHCYTSIMKYGRQAVYDMKNGIHSEAIDIIIKTNLYDSCVGFENGGLSVAHAFSNALTKCSKNTYMHGESVAIGLLVQLLLEKSDDYEAIHTFMSDVDLPISLTSLQLNDVEIRKLVEDLGKEEGMKHHRIKKSEIELRMLIQAFA